MSKFYSILLFVTIFCNELLAQNSEITIKITDTNMQPISGAYFKILNSPLYEFSDKNGIIKLSKPKPGKYTYQSGSLGFSTITKDFEVTNSNNQEIKVTLNESNVALNEIIITSEKKENRAIKVPISVTHFSADKIKKSRLWSFQDLTAIAPNFNIQPNDGGYYNMSVRGITSFSKLPSIVTYIDDVPAFNGYMMSFNMFDIDNMEFLRGPQGTLYGRGASAGVLIINSKKPTNKFEGFGELSYGNYNNQRYSIGVKSPILKDKIFFSLSGLFAQSNGFYHNSFLNKRAGDEKTLGVNAKLTFFPTKNWSIRYQFRMENFDQEGSYQYGINKESAFKNPYKVAVNHPGKTKRKFNSNSLVISYFGDTFSVKSISAFQEVDLRYGIWDLDGTPKDFQAYFTHSVDNEKPIQRYFTQELKLNGAIFNDKLNYTAGFFYMTGKEIDNLAYRYGKDSPPLNAGGITIPTPYNTLQFSKTDVESYAFYGQLTYNFNFGTKLTIGGRYEIEKSEMETRGDLEVLSINKTMPMMPKSKRDAKFKSFSPKASLLHKINDQNSIYATYSKGYRAGGVNPFTTDTKFLEFKPEFSNNYELGYKFLSKNKRFRANISGFWITLTDQQIYTLTGPSNFATVNIGEVDSKGAELEFSYLITKGLQFDGNLGYINAKYNKLPYFISDGKGGLTPTDLKNNKPIQSPNITSFNTLTYTTNFSKDVKFSIRGEWKFIGNHFFDYANQIEQKAFSLFNARATANYKNYSLSLWARNIADKKHIVFAYPFWLPNTKINNPRMFGATLNITF